MSIGLTRDEYEDEQRDWEDQVYAAFRAGYRACYDDVEDYDHDLDKQIERRLLEWM